MLGYPVAFTLAGVSLAFALFGSLAGFGIANTVQSNSVAQVMTDSFAVPSIVTGLVLMVLVLLLGNSSLDLVELLDKLFFHFALKPLLGIAFVMG